MMIRHLSLFTIFLLFILPNVYSQIIPPDPMPEPVLQSHQTILPIVGYSSDDGLYGGAMYQRIRLDENSVQPFISDFTFDILVSTRGNIFSNFIYQRFTTFGRPIRSRFLINLEREREAGFFGIGNNTVLSDDLYDEGFYYYENRIFRLNYRGRKNIADIPFFGKIDFFGLLSPAYAKGISNGNETLFSQDRPDGFESSWANKLGFGFIADSRDSEYIPTRGIRYEVELTNSNKLFLSDYSYTGLKADMRHYSKILPGVVLAHKFQLEHILGTAPFWDLSIIGNKYGLRGYNKDRFRGESSALSLLELRTWLFSFLDDDFRVGVQGFWDTGRVFSDADDNQFFNNWKQSYGAGLSISIFDPNLIIRGDLGFSDEATRIYFSTGYVF